MKDRLFRGSPTGHSSVGRPESPSRIEQRPALRKQADRTGEIMTDKNASNDDYSLAALDAREQLRRWDAGRPIWSIEMGGLGPGYEQAIQVLAIEIVRDNIDIPLPEKPPREWGDSTVARIDARREDGTYSCGGFSGAQVGAAKQLAYQWLRVGPRALHDRPEVKDRAIQVSNFWPHVDAPSTGAPLPESRPHLTPDEGPKAEGPTKKKLENSDA